MKKFAAGALIGVALLVGCNASESSSLSRNTPNQTTKPPRAAELAASPSRERSNPQIQQEAQPELASYWRVQGGNAVLTLDMIDVPQKGVKSALVLAHRPESGCKTEVGVAVSQGASLGRPIRQVRASSDMRIAVDGNEWTAPTIATQYEYAQERAFWAPDELVNALLDASIARATLGDDLFIIEFPVHGADTAIAEAMDNCHAISGGP